MADKEQVIIEYVLQEKGGEKVIATIDDIAESSDKAGKALTSALSEKQIDSATEKLSKFNTEVEKTTTEFSSAKAELNALTKEITSGKLQGKDLELAKKRAGELKDRIGDVRTEIGKLASDTRVFDTLVEGGRAVAASMSVAQGAAALFGEENKDLQKALLRTQGALALLTGAQELANILTTQGGIATQAYGFALRVVDGIQKAFAISSAAAWAAATAGLSLLIAGVVSLISYLGDAEDAAASFAEKKLAEDAANAKAQEELQKSIYDRIKQQDVSFREELDRQRKDYLLRGVSDQEAQFNMLTEIVDRYNRLLQSYARGEQVVELTKEREQEITDIIRDATLARKSILDSAEKKRIDDANKLTEEAKKAAEKIADKNLANDRAVIEEQLQLQKEFQERKQKEIDEARARNDLAKVEELRREKELFDQQQAQAQAYLDERTAAERKAADERRALTEATFAAASQAASSLASIVSSSFAGESAALQAEKERQLATVGENTKQREKIERDFAIKSAEIKRKQAIAERAFALVNIGVNTASAIVKQLAATPLPAGAPFVALIAATAALQTAAVLAQPLPEVPKFKEGVIGFKGKGSETSDENLVLISNNESVIKAKATSKYRDELQAANDLNLESFIYHKYLLPVLQKAGDAERDSSMYDDWLLRRTIKAGQEADRRNSQYIVNGILSGMRDSNRATQRHYA